MVLESAGYKVLAASDAQSALETLANAAVDLVITDYRLGESTGTELAAKLKEVAPGVPVLIVSGLPELPDGIGTADAFINKSLGPQVLLEKTSALLRRESRAAAGSGT